MSKHFSPLKIGISFTVKESREEQQRKGFVEGKKVVQLIQRDYCESSQEIILEFFSNFQGDDGQRFKATAKKLGDFAFLGVEFVGSDDILNRELREHFQFQIRAIARRKRANTLEAGCTVNLRILDENDNRPMFRQLDYRVEVDDRVSAVCVCMRLPVRGA